LDHGVCGDQHEDLPAVKSDQTGLSSRKFLEGLFLILAYLDKFIQLYTRSPWVNSYHQAKVTPYRIIMVSPAASPQKALEYQKSLAIPL
jgi:hypothetical protein